MNKFLLVFFILSLLLLTSISHAQVFVRGDANGDLRINITDAVTVLNYAFKGETSPGCLDAADADDDGQIGITDAINILSYLFLDGGPQRVISDPFPFPGIDTTSDELSCASYPPPYKVVPLNTGMFSHGLNDSNLVVGECFTKCAGSHEGDPTNSALINAITGEAVIIPEVDPTFERTMATGINNNQTLIGQGWHVGGDPWILTTGFVRNGDTLWKIPGPPDTAGNPRINLSDINNHGVVTGCIGDLLSTAIPFVWDSETGIRVLDQFQCARRSNFIGRAVSINDQNEIALSEVVGSIQTNGTEVPILRGVLLTDLGQSIHLLNSPEKFEGPNDFPFLQFMEDVVGLNNNGVIAGRVTAIGRPQVAGQSAQMLHQATLWNSNGEIRTGRQAPDLRTESIYYELNDLDIAVGIQSRLTPVRVSNTFYRGEGIVSSKGSFVTGDELVNSSDTNWVISEIRHINNRCVMIAMGVELTSDPEKFQELIALVPANGELFCSVH